MLVKTFQYVGEIINIQFHTYSQTYYFTNILFATITALQDLQKLVKVFQQHTFFTNIRTAKLFMYVGEKCFQYTFTVSPTFLSQTSPLSRSLLLEGFSTTSFTNNSTDQTCRSTNLTENNLTVLCYDLFRASTRLHRTRNVRLLAQVRDRKIQLRTGNLPVWYEVIRGALEKRFTYHKREEKTYLQW